MVEQLVIKDYIFPATSLDKLYDQFGFKPTVSITNTLDDITNTICIMLETNAGYWSIFQFSWPPHHDK